MEHDFWHQRWQDNEIGFHQRETHPLLDRFWPGLAVPADGRVLVPLCGKTLDMMWLRRQEHPVIGVELSAIAVESFIDEHDLELDRIDTPWGHRRVGAGFDLLVGDFFELAAFDIGRVAAIYDRAALVALPPAMRLRYAHQLAAITRSGTPMLTVTFSYDGGILHGPPFAVEEREVRELFPEYRVRRLAQQEVLVREHSVTEIALYLDPRRG